MHVVHGRSEAYTRRKKTDECGNLMGGVREITVAQLLPHLTRLLFWGRTRCEKPRLRCSWCSNNQRVGGQPAAAATAGASQGSGSWQHCGQHEIHPDTGCAGYWCLMVLSCTNYRRTNALPWFPALVPA